MTNLRFVPQALLDLYEVHEWRNGLAVLSAACPEEWADSVPPALQDVPRVKGFDAAGGDIGQALVDVRLEGLELTLLEGPLGLATDRRRSLSLRKYVFVRTSTSIRGRGEI